MPPREGEALAYVENLRKLTSETNAQPLLPYLGIFHVRLMYVEVNMAEPPADVVLRDILRIEDSMPSRTKNNLINFEKRVSLYSVIQKVCKPSRFRHKSLTTMVISGAGTPTASVQSATRPSGMHILFPDNARLTLVKVRVILEESIKAHRRLKELEIFASRLEP